MADQKNKITRYVTGDMGEDEEIAFEAEMADNDDLRLQVQLERMRLANIQRRVTAALESEEVKKTDETQKISPFDTLKVSNWRHWAVAAAVVGLTMAAIWLFTPKEKTGQISTNTGHRVTEQPKTDNNSSTDSTSEEPMSSPATPLPPDYNKIAHDTYAQERPKAEVLTSGEQYSPITNTDTATQAFRSYLEGDSAMVFAYYDRHANERRAVEWKARYLFEQHRYEEAAEIFAQLKTFPKYEDVGAWNELLCYLALYQTKKKDFERLKKEVRNTKYQEDLERLLKQIR